jgi:hypothetical protein
MTSIEEITDDMDVQDVRPHVRKGDGIVSLTNSLLQPKIQEVEDGEEDVGGGEVAVSDAVQSKAERKARKSLQGIGLKKVAGVNRVTMRRPRGVSFIPRVRRLNQRLTDLCSTFLL